MKRLRTWASGLKRDALALWIAARCNRTPLVARFAAGVVAAYALSPIDLIPDFIPIFGYLDDLLILPLGIALVIHLIPAKMMEEFRDEALLRVAQPRSFGAAAIIVLIWSVALVASGIFLLSKVR